MSKMKRITVAGPLVLESVYPLVRPRDSRAARSGKRSLSSEAQRRMNLKYSWQKLELLIAANFGPKDLFVTLTFADRFLPEAEKTVQSRVKDFIKAFRKARGENELRYIYAVEHKHRHQDRFQDGRWHIHIILNATGEDFALVQKLWKWGRADLRAVRVDKDRNFETLARYLCKEPRDKLGKHIWHRSRGLKRPHTDCFRVPDNEPLRMPPASRVIRLEDTGDVRTEYGHYRYIKYISRAGLAGDRPRAARRRRRKRQLL